MSAHRYARFASELPEPVRRKAHSSGEEGRRWIACLPEHVEHLARKWHFEPCELLAGGSEALIFKVALEAGGEAVVKMGMPPVCDCSTEATVLRIAGGRGYVELYDHDEGTNALLLELLNGSLASASLTLDRKIELLCETMSLAWVQLEPAPGLMTGHDKALWLADFIDSTWRELPGSCSEKTKDLALAFAEQRRNAHRRASSRLVHGDAHDHNALYSMDGSGRLKLIDPDGLFAEPACDLAVPMRSWSEELLRGDAVALGEARCRTIAALTGVDEAAIWQWGFMERVSTGLLLARIGMERSARDMLSVAEAWSDASLYTD